MSNRLDPGLLAIDDKNVEKKSAFNLYRGIYNGKSVTIAVRQIKKIFFALLRQYEFTF